MRVIHIYRSLFRAIFAAIRTPTVQALMLLCLLIAALLATIYRFVEGWPFLDGFYFAVVTMSTVGYGDLTPQTGPGKVVAIASMFFGIGIFVLAFSSFAQAFLHAFYESQKGEPRPGEDLDQPAVTAARHPSPQEKEV